MNANQRLISKPVRWLLVAFAAVMVALIALPSAVRGGNFGGLIITLIVGGLLAALYFLPTIIACRRGKANREAIALLNIFAGWTFVGWVAALVWASAVEEVKA